MKNSGKFLISSFFIALLLNESSSYDVVPNFPNRRPDDIEDPEFKIPDMKIPDDVKNPDIKIPENKTPDHIKNLDIRISAMKLSEGNDKPDIKILDGFGMSIRNDPFPKHLVVYTNGKSEIIVKDLESRTTLKLFTLQIDQPTGKQKYFLKIYLYLEAESIEIWLKDKI